MPAERHFRFRREVAHPPAAALPRRESRLGKADLGGDPPHLLGFRQRAADRHAGGVAAGCAIREGRNTEHVHLSHLSTGVVAPAAGRPRLAAKLSRPRGALQMKTKVINRLSIDAVDALLKIGRASCRARVWQNVSISVVAVYLKK